MRQKLTLMLCACEFWCGDPYITGEDALDDARQVVSMLSKREISDEETRRTIILISCRMLGNNRNLPPHEDIRRIF